MLKRSAGILVYKIDGGVIKVLLCHFGGPYWDGIDEGAWSIPKGELNKGENVFIAAKREFSEETGLKINNDLLFLNSKKISNKKLAIIFYANEDFDLSKCHSNTFKLEWPRGTGNMNEFPEMDKYEWMNIDVAKKYIINNQLFFLERLEERLLNS